MPVTLAGLEGIIAKKSDSIYAPDKRSKEWLKIKAARRQEVVIGGYTQNEGSSKQFSSLLVGVFNNGKLHYTGKIGTGFSEQLQKELLQQFDQQSSHETQPEAAGFFSKVKEFLDGLGNRQGSA